MIFNSLEFGLFLPIVFIGYWFIFKKSLRLQNLFLIVSSYVFYGWWDWRFLILILISSLTDYLVGYFLNAPGSPRKLLLYLSLGINLGMLFFFKYFNFFIESFQETFTFFGSPLGTSEISIILPVGISFYTFQTLSYTIDIYKGRFTAERDPLAFFAFVAFFPQLVAGPIERARNFLPQFTKNRVFDTDKSIDGARQALWGLFKKVVVADNCALIVDQIFLEPEAYGSSLLLLASFLFFVQLYADFSGYSDIAIGIGRLFGFSLSRNFNFPFLSLNIPEYWSKWHITLSSWFRDYVFVELFRGKKRTIKAKVINTIILFVLIGIWHGANWTFVVFGFLHGIAFIPSIVLGNTNFYRLSQVIPNATIKYFYKAFLSFKSILFISLTCIFFRAKNLQNATDYFYQLMENPLMTDYSILVKEQAALFFVLVMFLIEWFQRNQPHAFAIGTLPVGLRWGCYYLTTLLIIFFKTEQINFVYFQF